MTWLCWGTVVVLIVGAIAQDERRRRRRERDATRPVALGVRSRKQTPSIPAADDLARTEEELERLANVPCAPNPRLLS